MRRWWLFLIASLSFFNLQAFAQIGLVVQLTPTANIDSVATQSNGAIVGAIPEAHQFLLSVPATPHNLPDNEIHWMELNQGTSLPSGPHHQYVDVPATAGEDC